MSGYRGRHGPNLQNYINNLNQIGFEDAQYTPVDPNMMEENLAMFTNTDFIDYSIPPLSASGEAFNFDLEVPYASPTNLSGTYNTAIAPAPPANGFQMKQFPQLLAQSSPDASDSSLMRRAENSVSPAMSAEDASRHAAEEDKRRRNTAASARFRIKKKQREQNLEKNVKEAQDKHAKLEARIAHLEMENKWLKSLITEKKEAKSPEDIHNSLQRETEERETLSIPKRGVGTD